LASDAEFEQFVRTVDRPLRQALVAALGSVLGEDAHAAALAYAWEHQDAVMAMAWPVAYLVRVGRSSTRHRRRPLPPIYARPAEMPDFEPGLASALAGLPEKLRVPLFLTVGCDWSYAETARLLGSRESTIRARVQRGLASIRRELGVTDRDD